MQNNEKMIAEIGEAIKAAFKYNVVVTQEVGSGSNVEVCNINFDEMAKSALRAVRESNPHMIIFNDAELVAYSGVKIVSAVNFKDRLIVATEGGVFERLDDGRLHPIEFENLSSGLGCETFHINISDKDMIYTGDIMASGDEKKRDYPLPRKGKKL